MSDFIDSWGIPDRPDHEWNEYDLLRVWKSAHVEMSKEEEADFLSNQSLLEILKFNVDEIVTCLGFSSTIEDALTALNEIDIPIPEPIDVSTLEDNQ